MFAFQLISLIKIFKIKLSLSVNQLTKGNMLHFLTCRENIPSEHHSMVGRKCTKHISLLSEKFQNKNVTK